MYYYCIGMNKNIYVAATGQHIGKTTVTLGLIAALRNWGFEKVGYCKPVGQEITEYNNLPVDKDAFLFSKFMNFELASEVHSPVILGKGATTAYLDNPSAFKFQDRVLDAAQLLRQNNDFVVYEGTGHPGVGTVVDLSNAKVAKMLDANVVLVVEGGIGNTIDKLSLSIAKFREYNVPIIGIIINKVIPEKREKVAHYLQKKLKIMGFPILGVIPYDKSMVNPIMKTVKRATKSRVLMYGDYLANRVEAIAPGSLIDEIDLLHEQSNLLLVVSYKRAKETLEKIESLTAHNSQNGSPLSGIILTGEGRFENSIEEYPLYTRYIRKHQLPVISTKLDTLGAFTKINEIEVKINTSTPWKIERAINLVKQYVDMKPILTN